MHASSPEIWTFEVFLGIVPEQVLHVPADERRRVVVRCLEAVDHSRGPREQMLNAIPGRRRWFLGSLALADVAPRADHLGRLPLCVPAQSLRVAHPTIGAVLLAKSVLARLAAFPVQSSAIAF